MSHQLFISATGREEMNCLARVGTPIVRGLARTSVNRTNRRQRLWINEDGSLSQAFNRWEKYGVSRFLFHLCQGAAETVMLVNLHTSHSALLHANSRVKECQQPGKLSEGHLLRREILGKSILTPDILYYFIERQG